MKYEVLQGQDAEAARLAGKNLEWFDGVKGAWMPRHNQQAATTPNDLYRLAPEPVPPKRVPLGPEDVPPGSVFRWDCWKCQQEHQDSWAAIGFVGRYGITVQMAFNSAPTAIPWDKIFDGGEISRDGGLTWEPCSKEAR